MKKKKPKKKKIIIWSIVVFFVVSCVVLFRIPRINVDDFELTLELSSTTWEQGTTVESTARLTNVSGRNRTVYLSVGVLWSYRYYDSDGELAYSSGLHIAPNPTMWMTTLRDGDYVQQDGMLGGQGVTVGTWNLQVSLSMGSTSLWRRFWDRVLWVRLAGMGRPGGISNIVTITSAPVEVTITEYGG